MPTSKPSPGLVRDRSRRYRVKRSTLREDEILATASEILRFRALREGQCLSVSDTRKFLTVHLGTREHEVFAAAFLDNRHRVLAFEELFHGTINGASVHPREVVKRALALNAAAIVFAHNHPSGVAEPSQADRHITECLKEACALVDVRVLDHFVVGDFEMVSFAERGLL